MWLKAQCWHAVVKRVKNDYSDPFQHRFAAWNGLALTWENQCCCFNEQKKNWSWRLHFPSLYSPQGCPVSTSHAQNGHLHANSIFLYNSKHPLSWSRYNTGYQLATITCKQVKVGTLEVPYSLLIQRAIFSSPHCALGSLNMNQIPFHLDSTRKAQTFFVGVLFRHYNFGHVSKCDVLQYWLEADFHNLQSIDSASGFFCCFHRRG